MRPAKSATSRRIRGELRVDDRLDRQVQQPVRRDRVPAQRVTLDEHAAVDEPAGRRPDPGGVGPATDGLEAAPVERQGREVEQVEEGLGRPLDDGPALAVELPVREVDEVEVGATEPEPVPPLGDDDLLGPRAAAGLVRARSRWPRRRDGDGSGRRRSRVLLRQSCRVLPRAVRGSGHDGTGPDDAHPQPDAAHPAAPAGSRDDAGPRDDRAARRPAGPGAEGPVRRALVAPRGLPSRPSWRRCWSSGGPSARC